MLNLNNVTIVSINTRDPHLSIKAIERSCKYIKFAKALLLTDKSLSHKFIEFINISTINTLLDYSYFCVKHLNNYIDTEFCLIVQPDGFITNPLMWTKQFLQYDYIGAPWDVLLSQRALRHSLGVNIDDLAKVPIIVGNGGFSLRSKKLLECCSNLSYPNTNIPEDSFICVTNREYLSGQGIKFAPVNIASRFAIERPHDLNWKHVNLESYFGVHGYTELREKDLLFGLLHNQEKDLESIDKALSIFKD